MPVFQVTSPEGRKFELTAPEGATRQQLLGMLQKVVRPGIDPNTGRTDPSLAIVDRMMTGTAEGSPIDPTIADRLRSVKRETSIPLVGATMASIAFPPLAAGAATSRLPILLNALSRGAQRFGRPIAASGAGGGVGGAAVEADRPGSTPGSIAREALETGAGMAAAEAAGLGVTTAAARLAAPNLRFLDPLSGVRRQLGEFVKSVPERARAAARRVEEALPEGRMADAGEALRGSAQQLNDTFRRLVSTDTSEVALPQASKVAQSAARAIGRDRARRFGFDSSQGPRQFLNTLFRSGDREAMESLQKRMGKNQFNDALTLHLSTLIERATVQQSGRRVLDGDKLRQAWAELPEATRALYPRPTREAVEGLATFGQTLGRVGRFAASPVGGEVAEALVVPAATAVFGLGVGVPLLVAKSLINPGLVTRYLTREKLPSEIVQMIGGQAVKGEFRRTAGLLDDEG